MPKTYWQRVGVQARFPADAGIVAGQSREYVRIGDEGGSARFHFCSECGSTVFYRPDAIPDVVAIPVGAFADPDFPQPRVSVYEMRQHHWVHLPDDIEHLRLNTPWTVQWHPAIQA